MHGRATALFEIAGIAYKRVRKVGDVKLSRSRIVEILVCTLKKQAKWVVLGEAP